MTLYGFIEGLRGVTYPLIKTEFDVPYHRHGLMVSMVSFAYVCFCAAGGFIIARFGVRRALLAGFVSAFIGLGAVFFLPGYKAVSASLFVIGAAYGFFDVGVNALGAQVFTSKAALLMNLLHFFYGLGSSLSPKIAGTVSAGLGWRYVYLFSVPAALLFFIPALMVPFPEKERSGEAAGGTASFTRALVTPMVWLFSLALGFMVVVETASANWAGLYFQDVYSIDLAGSGAGFLSTFFIFFTLSRLLSGFVIEKIGYLRSLIGAALGVLLVMIIGFALGRRGIHVLHLLGIFTAIFWPTTMAVAMGWFGPRAPVMTSAMIVIAGTLNAAVQLLIGLTNRVIGPAWGYRSCFVYALLVVIALLALRRRIRGNKDQ
jgi:fucose permease